ncbi:MAG TPA: hypothetical protein VMM15_34025 [Bradyrhizobium sp.]|nr:hypothetical protein [Bradyrhizobium sp.]
MKPTHTLVLAGFLALAWTAPAMAGHLHIVNKFPAKNPCPEQLPQDVFDDLKSAIDKVGASSVPGEIDKDIDKTLTDAKLDTTGTVDVEVSIATDAGSYKTMMHDAGTNRGDKEMDDWFDKTVAHTNTVGHGDKQKVVVVFFCGEKLKQRVMRTGARTFVHELLHAGNYFTSLRGIPDTSWPYKEKDDKDFAKDQDRTGNSDEHNDGFHGFIERLTKLFDDEEAKKAEQPKVEEKPKTADKPKEKPKTADKPKEKPKTADKPKEKTKTADQPKKKANAQNNGGVSMPQSDVQFSFGVMGGGGDRRRDDRRDDPPVGGGGGNNNSGFKMR